jgi:hypothetical protein
VREVMRSCGVSSLWEWNLEGCRANPLRAAQSKMFHTIGKRVPSECGERPHPARPSSSTGVQLETDRKGGEAICEAEHGKVPEELTVGLCLGPQSVGLCWC